MAHFNQEKKKQVAPAIKAVLKKFGIKGSIAVRDYSTLVVNIKSGKLDFCDADFRYQQQDGQRAARGWDPVRRDYIQVNRYYEADHMRAIGETEIAEFYDELIQAMLGAGWYDNSDAMTDYFDTAYYLDINIGQWNKPYELTV